MLEDSTITDSSTTGSYPRNIEQALEEMKRFSEAQKAHEESELPRPFFKVFMCFGARVG